MTVPRRRWLSGLLDLVFPPHCVACHRHGEWFCNDCRSRIVPMAPPLCARCGQTLDPALRCPSCLPITSWLAAVRSVGPYEPPLSAAIRALKYDGMRVLAGSLAQALAHLWAGASLPIDIVAPVPLHRARQRARGYNQAALLAREFGALTGLPVSEDLVTKARDTRPQVGLGRQDRLRNVRGAYAVRSTPLAGARVLLIDDVLTTGATLEACAEPLAEAGARAVYAITLARSTLTDGV